MGPKRGRPSKGDAALTGAERYKRYREKHLVECRESEALRKRHKREVSKLNPVADAARRKKQAIAKRVQRQRRKNEGKVFHFCFYFLLLYIYIVRWGNNGTVKILG